MSVRPIIAPSARKHEVTDVDMLHAFDHPIKVFELDEGFTLIVGPSTSSQLLEIGVVAGDLAPVIVHAMPAREKALR